MNLNQVELDEAIQRKEMLETIYQYLIESYNAALIDGNSDSMKLLIESLNRVGKQLNELISRIDYLKKVDPNEA